MIQTVGDRCLGHRHKCRARLELAHRHLGEERRGLQRCRRVPISVESAGAVCFTEFVTTQSILVPLSFEFVRE